MSKPTRACILIMAVVPVAGTAQVSIGPDGIRSGNTVIDANGIHTRRAGGSQRGDMVIRTNVGARRLDCAGGELTLDGNGNRFQVAHCSGVTVNGNGNVLIVTFDRGGRLAVLGNRNQVTWRAAPRAAASVDVLGSKNAVRRSG